MSLIESYERLTPERHDKNLLDPLYVSPESKAYILSNTFAGLIRQEDLEFNSPDEEMEFVQFLFEGVDSYLLFFRDKFITPFHFNDIYAPDGFGKFNDSTNRLVYVKTSYDFNQYLDVDKSGNLDHLIRPVVLNR